MLQLLDPLAQLFSFLVVRSRGKDIRVCGCADRQ